MNDCTDGPLLFGFLKPFLAPEEEARPIALAKELRAFAHHAFKQNNARCLLDLSVLTA